MFESSKHKKYLWILIFLTGISLLSSCYKKQENTKNPFFIKAMNSYNDGDYNQSSFYYQKYLNLYPMSSKANYNLATIYLEQENYIQSISHFKRFLTLEPNSPDKPVIKKWIEASEGSLYKELEKEYSDSETVSNVDYAVDIKLENELKSLKKKNKQMRDFILKHKKTLVKEDETGETTKLVQNKSNNIKTSPIRTYEVQSGDTLYKISQKMYNSSEYHNLIWEANKDQLKSPSALRPGEILTIPKIK